MRYHDYGVPKTRYHIQSVNHKKSEKVVFLDENNLKIVYNCILVHFGLYNHSYDFIFVQKYFITYSLLFSIFSRI